MLARCTKTRRSISLLVALCMLLSVFAIMDIQTVKAATSYLISQNRTAYASSTYGNGTSDLAVDSNNATRWESGWGAENQWIYIDLGATAAITQVVLKWESAFSKSYKIQVSNDEFTWNDIHSNPNGVGGTETLNITGSGRYVRLLSLEKSLPAYGISLFEFQVYGTGGVNPPPVDYGANIALGKAAAASSEQADWYITPGQTAATNAVDGNITTRWGSNMHDPEWIYVDLGATHTVGRVILKWEPAAARTYDIQVSNDKTNWTTVYRTFNGAGGTENIQLYATGRYVRLYGISRATTFGYSLFEFEIYDYKAGDPQPAYTIPVLPTPSTVTVGSGSYLVDDITFPVPKQPAYKSSNIDAPIPSNDWWQSLLVNNLGNALTTLPFKNKFTKQGLSILNPGAGYSSGINYDAGGPADLYLMASNINTSLMKTKIVNYGDWSADAVLSDDTTDKMKVTFVKGSPYIYSQFTDSNSVELYSGNFTRFFDDNNNNILATDGASFTADHIGIQITNKDGAATPSTFTRYYGVFAPAGSVFKKVGNKIKIQLGNNEKFLSLATIPSYSNLNYFYQHGYAFVTDTNVSYSYNEASSNVTTNFNFTISNKRTGFSGTTLAALLPHQWKITTSPLTSYTYPSIRGTMKIREGNTFTTVDKFYGIVPQFTEPTDGSYSRTQLITYLDKLDTDLATNGYTNQDPYWQGKKLHPLGEAVLIADQIGDITRRDKYLGILKTILIDWYTYTNGEPSNYFYYDEEWGTLIYKYSEFGANTGLTDHHFTYGYYLFASAVVATYDSTFMNNYKDMIENLIRDYANPSRTDSMYPMFRNFDPYEGHSWASGYADNEGGNNQEAAAESLFGWVGEFLWGVATGNDTYRDAAIYGFTTEEKAIEQYWFNYDNDNFIPSYNYNAVGQVWGSGYLFGNYFWGCPKYNYGIHWLPTSEYLTYYSKTPGKGAELYNDFIEDNGGHDELTPFDPANPEPDSWYHIVWPIQALSNPQGVISKWDANVAKAQQNEVFNTYWFVHSMATLGQRSTDIWSSNWPSSTVYKNGAKYTALVWNPTSLPVTVTFADASGARGSAVVPAKSTVSVDPTQNQTTTNTPIPGKVQAESYSAMSGIQTEATGDIEGGLDVGYTDTGDYMDYNVNVATAGTYNVDFRVASPSATGQVQLKSGSNTLCTVNVPNTTAWQTWQTVSSTVNLSAGNQVLRVYVSGGGFNLNWMNFSSVSAPVTTPTLTPAPGTYTTAQNVTISCATAGATIKYTTDGSTPTANSATYTAAIPVIATTTIKAYATKSGMTDSAVVTGGYTINISNPVAVPTFTPAPGTYTTAQNVTISCATSGATVKYTTDGSTPTANSATYTAAIPVIATTTIKAYAFKSGMTDSTVATAAYTISSNLVNLALNKTGTASSGTPGPAFDGNAGTRWESNSSDPQWIYVDLGANNTVSGVKLNWETASGKTYKIQTSTDAVTWTDVYTQPNGAGGIENLAFTPVTARYVRMYGTVRNTIYGYSLWELEVYGQTEPQSQVATPTFTPAAGTYTSAQSVTLASATSGATIKYTTDGSTPTASSATYTAAIPVTATTTIKAYAFKSGMTDSAVASGAYTINIPTGIAIPGKIEAENYSAMSGIQTEATGDTGGGLNVGFIDTGDYMDYNVNVATAGTYNVDFRVASPSATGQVQLRSGANTLCTANVPNTTGWQTWQTVSSTVNLTAGNQVLRVYVSGSGFNLNWIDLSSVSTPVATPTFTPAPGTYTTAQNVTISCATAGATIKYTTDGSTPTASSATYTAAINVAATTVIKAIATKSGMTDSAVATGAYTISSNPVNLALNKLGTTSSGTPGPAFDGDAGTRWESASSDPQWIYVDLGANNTVSSVKLNWETASGKTYKIQTSTDAVTWTDVYTQPNGAGGIENLAFTPVTARYVRMYGTARNTIWGYSLWEFEVYG